MIPDVDFLIFYAKARIRQIWRKVTWWFFRP